MRSRTSIHARPAYFRIQRRAPEEILAGLAAVLPKNIFLYVASIHMYTYAPFFSGYFESLGVKGENLVYSDFTSGEMYREGATRGAIDPCFPAKVAIAHVHNLLIVKHAKKPLDGIFFPMVDVLYTPLKHLQGSNACPTVTVTPETAKAAFIKETDLFASQGVVYLNPLVNFQKDIDENKPSGSIKIRLETIHYFLKREERSP